MPRFFEALDENLEAFVNRQHVFFTASAPAEGRINLSPKGMDTFRVLDSRTVAYLDLTGSGNETAAHLQENGRLTIMFCSFDRKPLILRLYGMGTVIGPRNPRWQELVARFPTLPGRRQIIVLRIQSLQTSCGFAVPVYEFSEERQTLREWAEVKGEEALAAYRRKNNAVSIDGKPTQLDPE